VPHSFHFLPLLPSLGLCGLHVLRQTHCNLTLRQGGFLRARGRQSPAARKIQDSVFSSERLAHREEAERFYRDLAASGVKVSIGIEASGHARWFERLLAELNFELWMGDATEIRAKRVRKKKTDREDARHILGLLLEDRFPRIWVPSTTVRSHPEWRSKFFHLAMRRGRKIAKVAMARRLAVRLYWMWREERDYEHLKKFGPHAGQPGSGVAVQQNIA
jgi:hypothetical protein